jgi:hypothetical protein
MRYTLLPLLFLLLVVGHEQVAGLFVNATLPGLSPRNILCRYFSNMMVLAPVHQAVYGFNVAYNFSSTGTEFCIVQHISITQPNGSIINTTFSSFSLGDNPVQQHIRRRCTSGTFTSSSPIGYSACTRLPHDRITKSICICSTNLCNENYATCVASVQAAQSPLQPNVAFDLPELTNLISCSQGYHGPIYQDIYQATGFGFNAFTPLNLSQARAYAANNAVACAIYVHPSTGDSYQIALPYEDYSGILLTILGLKQTMSTLTNYSEGATNVWAQVSMAVSINAFFAVNTTANDQIICFCTTNYCNQNLSTCSNGLNITGSSSTSVSSSSTGVPTTLRTTTTSGGLQTTASPGGTTTPGVQTTQRRSATARIGTFRIFHCLALLLFLL